MEGSSGPVECAYTNQQHLDADYQANIPEVPLRQLFAVWECDERDNFLPFEASERQELSLTDVNA